MGGLVDKKDGSEIEGELFKKTRKISEQGSQILCILEPKRGRPRLSPITGGGWGPGLGGQADAN
jgi:hypothetical protein